MPQRQLQKGKEMENTKQFQLKEGIFIDNYVNLIELFQKYLFAGWTSENDLDIEVKYCGFSPFADIHLANYDWGTYINDPISAILSRV